MKGRIERHERYRVIKDNRKGSPEVIIENGSRREVIDFVVNEMDEFLEEFVPKSTAYNKNSLNFVEKEMIRLPSLDMAVYDFPNYDIVVTEIKDTGNEEK